jgi:hypothetical protein
VHRAHKGVRNDGGKENVGRSAKDRPAARNDRGGRSLRRQRGIPDARTSIMRIMTALCALAALVAAAAGAVAQTPMGDAPFCLKSAAGPTSCIYPTLAACEQAKPAGSGDQCLDRMQAGATTGRGGMAPIEPPPAGGGMQPPPSGTPQR